MELPNVNLLQAAVILAEVRNFSRAAQKLGIHQPTLTKRILELEQIVGFKLFLRSTQFVEPTEACKQFVEEAKQSLFHIERSLHVVRAAEKGARSVLHVGKSQYADPYLISVLNSISLPLYPNLEIQQSSMYSSELESELLLGKLDLAIAVGNYDSKRLTQLEVMRSNFYIVVPESSPLAQHEYLSINDLDGLSWVLFDRRVHPGLYDALHAAARAAQARPQSVHHVTTAEEAAQELYPGACHLAFLTRAGAWRIAVNGLTMRPLEHAGLELSTKLIARSNDSSRLLSEFVRCFKQKLDVRRKTQLALPLG